MPTEREKKGTAHFMDGVHSPPKHAFSHPPFSPFSRPCHLDRAFKSSRQISEWIQEKGEEWRRIKKRGEGEITVKEVLPKGNVRIHRSTALHLST